MTEGPTVARAAVPTAGTGTVLVTGATGYIGGRLIPHLLSAGYRVRCMVRDPSRLEGRRWRNEVEVCTGDVLDPASLEAAVAGVDAAYYFVHSMAGGREFHERDLRGARNFSTAMRTAGGRRIIYLGGLGDPEGDLSEHLRSRQDTGHALREAGVPVTEFRAAVIVGSGSLSFEIVRYLTERVPILICPRWVFTRVQPISTRDVLQYLVAALSTPASTGQVIEIGGADVVSYAEMMTGYAKVRGLTRRVIPVPFLTPRYSAGWVHLVTPVPRTIARALIEGLRNEVVMRSDAARRIFPGMALLTYEESVRLALRQLDASEVETSWSDALSTSALDVVPVVLTSREGMEIEQRQRVVQATPRQVFLAFTSLGGDRGWLTMNWAWQLRGVADRMIGGVGMRRGRRHPVEVRAGDAVDFWRVEQVKDGELLRLRAEMKVPGRAWLEFSVVPHDAGTSLLTQTALFAPRGLFGWLYWYAMVPLHALIFSGMIRQVGRVAESTPP
ncbi:MAG: SDR family oxidoreductase [Gemmatimonadetes bacterium]|nr:SDR family oxidoreductase [Gemmatimonadota bacterium]